MKIPKQLLFIFLIFFCFDNLIFSQNFSAKSEEKRSALVKQLKNRLEIRDRKILYSIGLVDREKFIPEKFRKYTYTETSVPLSNGKTIPTVSEIVKVLLMADTKDKQKILIIGNNAGYSAALFSYFYDNVYLIETDLTKEKLYKKHLIDNHNNITAYYGFGIDAFQGYGPFDAIFIHGSVQRVEPVFFDMLKSLGEIIFPLESPSGLQQIVKYRKIYSEISISSGGISNFSSLKP